jgi:PAS domain S-box-containing protein
VGISVDEVQAMKPQGLTVLLVDDNPHDRHLVLRELKLAYPNATILEAIDQEQFEALLAAHEFDVVVTDHHLHWSDGIQVLQTVKSQWPSCPVIMFTGTGSEEIAVEAMKLGLDDYIIKSVKHLVRLRAAVESVIERTRDRIHAAETKYRLDLLLSNLDVGVFSCTAEGTILELNDTMVRFLNCATADEARQSGLARLFGEHQQAQSLLNRVVATRSRQECEIEWRSPEGEERNYRVNASLLLDDERAPRIEGLVEDVTQRKQAEARAKASAVAAAQVAMLSPREREVLELVVTGEANKVVARRLDISEKTVEKHRSSLMKKMNVRNVAELVRVSMLAGVVAQG